MSHSVSGDSLLISTATYNEAENINEWINRVRTAHPRASVLIVDDNSPDGTAEIIRKHAETDERLNLIVRKGKLGIGSAHRVMMVFALENSFSTLVTLDADLSHQPEEISLLLGALETHDFVVGTRSGEGFSEYTGLRRFISIAGNRAAQTLVPTGLTEYTTSMRAFRREALEALLAHGVRDEAYAFFMECVVAMHRCQVRMTEVPIRFLDRTRGKSKLPKRQVFLSALALVRLSLDNRLT
jgi:dolichol-phosphate mannosyltransferase